MKSLRLPSVFTRGLAALALVPVLAASPALRAQNTPAQTDDTHIVSSSDLQQQVQASSETRQQQVDNLTKFMSQPGADQAMRNAHVDPNQVRAAIPTLSDAELANLSARANHAQQQFSAGFLGLGWLLTIIVIIAIIIVVVTLA